jgi:Tfp pilus assembly protein PilV
MPQQTLELQLSRARPARRGSSLLDGLIARAILAFGLLAMTRLQGRTVTQATEAQFRQAATQLAAELLATVQVDVANAACYTLPQAGACANAAAIARTAEWSTRVSSSLSGSVVATSTLDAAAGRLAVLITWTGRDAGDTHQLEVVTDVRP